MRSLEDNLRHALRRQEPPEGFAERVLSRIPPRPEGWKPRLAALFRMPAMRWATVGVVIVCLLFAGWIQQERERQIRVQGEIAKEQLLQALRIASIKLNTARKMVNDASRRTTQLQAPVNREVFHAKG